MQPFDPHTKRLIPSHGASCGGGFRPIVTLALAAVFLVLIGTHSAAEQHTWVDQFGSSNAEQAASVAAGIDAVFVAGSIDGGALDGMTSNGGADAFVRCYDSEGRAAWTRQFGTQTTDRAYAVVAMDNGCLVAGSTSGSLGGDNAGLADVFVQRRSAEGDIMWTMQFGSSGTDEAAGLVAHGSDIYVVGWTDGTLSAPIDSLGRDEGSLQPANTGMDAFLIKLDADGSVVWDRQFGTPGFDKAYAVSVADGGVYVTGRVGSALPGQTHSGSADVFVRRYDPDGNEVWTQQFGTPSSDIAYALAADAIGVYVAGTTRGALPGLPSFGGKDAFVRRYDHTGAEVWTRQIGGTGADDAYSIALDPSGVYLAGRTDFGLDGQPPSAGPDVFLVKMDNDGVDLWVDQLGSTSSDANTAVAVSPMGAYVAGWTFGEMPGTNGMGGRDAFVLRYDVPAGPEPEPELLITLDVNPGECPKSINVRWIKNLDKGEGPKSHMGGVLPVALSAGPNVDINEIDPSSCRLEGIEPLRWSYEDVSSPRANGDCECESSQPDGIVDLTMKFSLQELIDALLSRGTLIDSELILTGTLLDGTPVEAMACVSFHHGEDLVLAPAHPNPFNPTTVIEYSIARELPVTLSIYDISGRLVTRLVQQTQVAGDHSVRWDANGVASGVYYYQVRAGESIATGRVTMIK